MNDDSTTASADVEAELARLRAENEQLRGALDRSSSRGGARRWVSVVLAVVVAVLVPISLITVWAEQTLLSTDGYVDTVAPLARDDAVQRRVGEVITTEINASVEFDEIAAELLPEDLQVLAGPIAGGAQQVVGRAVTRIVEGELFAELWTAANREAHAVVLAVLTGEGSDLVETSGGRIAVDLAPVVDRLDESLGGLLSSDFVSRLGLDQIEVEYTLLESEELARAQDAARLLDRLGWIVPLVTIVLAALAVLVAEDRRLGFRRVGLAFVFSAIVTIVLVALLRGRVLDAAVDPDAASAAFDTMTRYLSRALRAVVALGVVVLAAVWLVGGSSSAVRARTWWDGLIGRAGEDREPEAIGAVPVWVAAHRGVLQVLVTVVAGLAIVLWTRPTGLVVLVIGLALVAALAVIAVLARLGERAATGPDDADVAQAAQSAQ